MLAAISHRAAPADQDRQPPAEETAIRVTERLWRSGRLPIKDGVFFAGVRYYTVAGRTCIVGADDI